MNNFDYEDLLRNAKKKPAISYIFYRNCFHIVIIKVIYSFELKCLYIYRSHISSKYHGYGSRAFKLNDKERGCVAIIKINATHKFLWRCIKAHLMFSIPMISLFFLVIKISRCKCSHNQINEKYLCTYTVFNSVHRALERSKLNYY